MKFSHIILTGLLITGLSASLVAQTITLPSSKNQAQSEFSVQLPGRGMSMESVQNKFGQAQEKYDAVGIPPITRWVYDDFTVYFESEYVIHAVVNK